jgi:hypothetical protein
MAFSEWEQFENLLNSLEATSAQWSGADSFETFDSVIRVDCANLVDGEHGYANLVTRLMDSGDYADTDELFEHLRLVLLAAPAERGETHPGTYRDDEGDAHDPSEQRFDETTGRWRRLAEQGDEYEYFHSEANVWERVRDDRWHRFHDGVRQWLAYDEASGTWLENNQWRPYEQVGAGIGEQDDDVILTAMAKEFDAAVAAVRELGVSDEDLSDDELFDLFEQRSGQLLASEVPELGQLSS